jgi:uncharacterized membrane protein (UPF0127 family)
VSSSSTFRLETADGVVIATEVAAATSLWARFCGLMMRKELPEGHGLCLRPCSQIHMFFMRFALDVAFVNKDGKVLHVLHGIRPWRISRIVFGAAAAIELNPGVLKKAGVVKGSVVKMV